MFPDLVKGSGVTPQPLLGQRKLLPPSNIRRVVLGIGPHQSLRPSAGSSKMGVGLPSPFFETVMQLGFSLSFCCLSFCKSLPCGWLRVSGSIWLAATYLIFCSLQSRSWGRILSDLRGKVCGLTSHFHFYKPLLTMVQSYFPCSKIIPTAPNFS